MLVLTRNEGERILIGPDIVMTVVRIGQGRVRLGIDAPENVLVLRSELFAIPAAPPGGEPASFAPPLAPPADGANPAEPAA